MKSFKQISLYITALLGSAGLVSCLSEEPLRPGQTGEKSDVIMVGANVDGALTRTLIESGPVTTGKFTLTYPWSKSTSVSGYGTYRINYREGEVEFDNSGGFDTKFVNISFKPEEDPRELVWGSSNSTNVTTTTGIFVESNRGGANLFLDNVPLSQNRSNSNGVLSNVNDTIVDLTKLNPNPYVASLYDDVNGTNDLLWGTTHAEQYDETVMFNLQHLMSRVRVKVQVKNPENPEDEGRFTIDLSNAEITLTSVQHTATTFYRIFGKLDLAQTTPPTPPAPGDGNTDGDISPSEPFVPRPIYEPIVMLNTLGLEDYNPGEPYTGGETDSEGNPVITWGSYTIDGGLETFMTKDFIFPPQELLRTGTDRPELIIKVPTENVNNGGVDIDENVPYVYFKGYLNKSMESEGTPLFTDFLSGHVLTINAIINPDGYSLDFNPVTVEQWVPKGPDTEEAPQAGIHTSEDFYNLIKYYNGYQGEGKEDMEGSNTFWLGRYGYQSNGVWVFQFQKANIELERAKIQGKMVPTDGRPDFRFDFRGRYVYLLVPEGGNPIGKKESLYSTAGQNTLKTIVTADGTGNAEITTSDEFMEMIKQYQANSWQLVKYGEYNDNEFEWEFKIAQNISLKYEDILAQMIPEEDEVNFSFIFESGVTVTVTDIPEDSPFYEDSEEGTLTLTNSTGAQILFDIVSTRLTGIYNANDFYDLEKIYTSKNTNLEQEIENLSKYGTMIAEKKWVFNFMRNNIVLQQSGIQGFMRLADSATETDKRINFSFDFAGFTVQVKMNDNSMVNISTENLYRDVTGPKLSSVTSAAGFNNVINYYKSFNPETATVYGFGQSLSTYGYYNNAAHQWILQFGGNVTLDYKVIFGSMASDLGMVEFYFNMNSYTVTVSNMPDGAPNLTLTGLPGGQTLLRIVKGTYVPEP